MLILQYPTQGTRINSKAPKIIEDDLLPLVLTIGIAVLQQVFRLREFLLIAR